MKSVEQLAKEILGRLPEKASTGPQQLKPETVEWYREFIGFDTCDDSALEDALVATAAFCNAVKHHDHRARYWLTLIGPCGIGKTHLARAVCKLTYARGVDCRFIRWSTALNYMRDGHHNYVHELAKFHMLVIDDIGAEHGSEYGTQKLLELLDRRAGKWTFITSNLTMERFAELDNRIASRLIRSHNRVLQIVTQDYALRKNDN